MAPCLLQEPASEPWNTSTLVGFGIALAIGGLIGVERERKKRAGEPATGGLRTFVLYAEVGAVSAWLSQELATPWIFVAGGVLVTALAIAGYLTETRLHPDSIGLTSELAGLATYLLGGAVLFGHAELAVPLAIATAAVLAFKEPLHGLVERIGRADLEATLKLLLATFVVLPVLPNRPLDPLGVFNPYETWWIVILISGLSMLGYVATRLLGAGRGLLLTGLAGGLVSSTAVTLGLAQQSKERPSQPAGAFAAGVLLSWAVMFVRVAVVVAVVQRSLLRPLLVPIGVMGAVSLGAAIVLYPRGSKRSEATSVKLSNPFRLTASLRFALLLSALMFVVELARRKLPEEWLYAVAAVAGLTDVDAITLSMARFAREGGAAALAAGAIVTAALANTLAKAGLVAFSGTPALRNKVGVTAGIVMASGLVALLVT